MSRIAEQINAILHREFEIPQEELSEGTSIREGLGLDSLDAVDLAVLLEEESGVKVDPKDFAGLETLGDIHRLAEGLLSKAAG